MGMAPLIPCFVTRQAKGYFQPHLRSASGGPAHAEMVGFTVQLLQSRAGIGNTYALGGLADPPRT
jgi:hypothetical protein